MGEGKGPLKSLCVMNISKLPCVYYFSNLFSYPKLKIDSIVAVNLNENRSVGRLTLIHHEPSWHIKKSCLD